MVIEWLKFNVAPDQRERLIQKDEEIWTAALAQYPGFLSKEVWIDPHRSDEVVFVIRWRDRDAWKSVPADLLEETEQRFSQAMGATPYTLTEAGEFQIRKFPQSSVESGS